MNMYFVYMDDARDEKMGIFSALAIPAEYFNENFNILRKFRRKIKQSDGIYIYKELHAWKFVSGRGRISCSVVTKFRRCEIFCQALDVVAGLKGAMLFNASFVAKKDEKAFEWLLNRVNIAMQKKGSQAIIIIDKGKEIEYTRIARRMRVYNPIPSSRGMWKETSTEKKNIPISNIVEDPFFKDSQQSYFIQMADFCAYSLLRRERQIETKNKYNLHQAFNHLSSILVREAFGKDPEGIIRII